MLESVNPFSRFVEDYEVEFCIFTGKLQKESKVVVSVTGGCPGSDVEVSDSNPTQKLHYSSKLVDSCTQTQLRTCLQHGTGGQ